MSCAFLLAALVAAGAPSSAPAPASLVSGWYGDLFEGATLDDPTVLSVSARPAFFALDEDHRKAIVAEVLDLWVRAQPGGTRYLEIHGGDAGLVYRSSTVEPLAVVAEWGGEAPRVTPAGRSHVDAQRALGGDWYFGVSMLGSLEPSFAASLRVGSYLAAQRWDASVGLLTAVNPDLVTVGLSGMVRRHIFIDAVPGLRPNLGAQVVWTMATHADQTIDPGVVCGVTLRPGSGPGMIDLVFFKGLIATSFSAGYTVLF
jgi:hypothetical protein